MEYLKHVTVEAVPAVKVDVFISEVKKGSA